MPFYTITHTEQRGALLYENSAKANDRLTLTMQWAIGLVASFILILLGSQVFFNYRISKEEISAIQSELEEHLANLKSDLIEKINKTSNEHEKYIQSSYRETALELKDDISNQLKEKEKLFEAIIDSQKKDNELLEKEFNSKLNAISIDLEKTIGHVWNLRGIKANALGRFIYSAKLQIERGTNTEFILDEIINVLKEMEDINLRDYDRLEEILPTIPADQKDSKKKIESLYKNLPKYTFIDDPERPGKLKTKFL